MPDPVQPGALVTLTGASGFVAKHLCRRLLEMGYGVRATVRSSSREQEVRQAVLQGLGGDARDRLFLTKADLLVDKGWSAALSGASALVHTASPFPLKQPRDPQDAIRPAVEGTRRVLEAAAAGVTRVILTSSVAAVLHRPPPAIQSEEDWADPDLRTATAYERSKTLAEREAWRLARVHNLDLTTINPGLIFGPLLDAHFGTSVGLVQRILKGQDPMQPNVAFPVVDVRDVVAMHVSALQTPGSVGERIIASAGSLSFPEMARVLKAAYPSRSIATRIAPSLLLRAMSLVRPEVRPLLPVLGRRNEVSNNKARRLFGMDFIPAEDALRATARDLVQRRLA